MKKFLVNRLLKYAIEAFTGVIILVVSVRVLSIPLSLPLCFIRGTDSRFQSIMFAVLVIVSYIIAAFITYKAVRFIHKHLEINGNG